MGHVQFDTEDVEAIRTDFAILGLTAEIIGKTAPFRGGKVIATYVDWRTAEKLRDYLESHHCAETEKGPKTLPVAGWAELVEASRRVHL